MQVIIFEKDRPFLKGLKKATNDTLMNPNQKTRKNLKEKYFKAGFKPRPKSMIVSLVAYKFRRNIKFVLQVYPFVCLFVCTLLKHIYFFAEIC